MPVGFVIFQTGNQANGGVESITQIVERTRRIRPLVVTQRETATTQRWRDAGLDVEVLPGSFEAWSEGRRHAPWLLRNNAWMASFVRRHELGVVHVNDIRAWMNAATGAHLAGARLVLAFRGTKPRGQAYTVKWRLAASTADLVIANSAAAADEVRTRVQHRLRRADVEHIYSAADLARLTPASVAERAARRRRLALSEDRVVIAYVAAVAPLKGQLAFLERGLASLVAAVPSALVCFVGDYRPEQDEYARQCAAALARSGYAAHVRFVGFAPEVADWYRAADLVLVASHAEGLARCMIEALACGTPVVSFDVCSAREILVDHDCGLVVPEGDYDGLAASVRALAGDPRRREQMGTIGSSVARDLFDPATAVARYDELYLRLAGAHRG